MKMKQILALTLALAMVLPLAAYSGGSAPKESKAPESQAPAAETGVPAETGAPAEADSYKELTIGSTAAKFVGHFDPTGLLSTDNGSGVQNTVYDALFYIDPYTYEWKSDILDSWSFDSETHIAAFTLKDCVKFASGDPMEASNIIYSYYRMSQVPRQAGNFKVIDFDNSYVSDDNLTAYFQFRSDFGAVEEFFMYQVVNESWVNEHGGDEFDWFDYTLVDGSGPYKVTEFTVDTSTTVELRDDWWGWDAGIASADYCSVDKMTFLQYSDENTMMVDYENNVLDMVLNLGSVNAERVQNNASLGTLKTPSSNAVAMLTMDDEGDEHLANKDLRAAICYGTDTNALGQLSYGILYKPATSTLAANNPFFIDGYTYEYNPDKARECLANSGLDPSTFTLTYICPNNPAASTMAEAFQFQMQELGIQVDLQIYDQATCIEMWQQEGANDFFVDQNSNVNVGNSAYKQYDRLQSTTNFKCPANFSEELNSYLEQGKYSSDPEVQKEAYSKVQQYLYDNYLVVPMCEWLVAYAYHDTIADANLTGVYTPNMRYLTK